MFSENWLLQTPLPKENEGLQLPKGVKSLEMKQGATLSSLVEPLLKGILDGYHSVDAEGKDHPIDQEYYKDWKLKKECIDHLVMMTNALANKEIISDPNNIIAGTKLYYDEKIVSGIVNDYFIQKEIEKEVKKVKEDVAK